MTFFLGLMTIVVINSMFVSMGGGYKKYPPVEKSCCNCNEEKKSKGDDVILN